MKSLYLTAFLALNINIYAQENKTSEPQDQAQIVKQAKEHEAQLLKDNQENAQKKQSQNQLVSDQSLEVKKQETKAGPSDNTGKLLPNTASFEEILATIPNRQKTRKTIDSRNTSNNVKGLPNTATLEEIKKTIPKN